MSHTPNTQQALRRFLGLVMIVTPLFLGEAWAATTSSPAHSGPLSISQISPSLKELHQLENGLTIKIMVLLVQLAVVLTAAKLGGAAAEKIKIPGVLGELVAGMLVGPFALGRLIALPVHGHWVPLFPHPVLDAMTGRMQWPVSDELWHIAQLASVVLLFLVGLHTNLKQFLRYMGPASLAAVGGVVVPFFLGAWAMAYFGLHLWHRPLDWYSPEALFIGAVLVATSVGITARVLADIKKLDTPEGVTILGAAVVDDVLGILVLSIVAAVSQSRMTGEAVNVGAVAIIAVKAILFWLGLTALGLVLASPIERAFNAVQYPGARLGLALALALFCAAAAEMFGLAFIIGAYSIGLALSKTKMAHSLVEELSPINDFVVPVFFAVMGMLVDFRTMGQALGLGLVISGLAILGKLLGCGIPVLFAGFTTRGALRVGIGMLPRGEVALIMAGVGLARGFIDQSLFGVAILMTLLTTVMAPLLLVPAFQKGGPGTRRKALPTVPEEMPVSFHAAMSPGLGRLFVQVLTGIAQRDGYAINYDEAEQGIYLLRKDDKLISIRLIIGDISIHATTVPEAELDRLIGAVERTIEQAVADIRPDL